MTNHTQTTADTAAIRAIFERLVAYWNAADGAGYGTLFTADADYIDVTGTRTRGGAAIGAMHQFLFDGPLRGSQLEAVGDSLDIAFLAPGIALVIAGGSSRLEGQVAAPSDRDSINTTVLVKTAEGWLIRSFQNNRVMRRGG